MKGSNDRQRDDAQPFVLTESNLEILPVFKVTGRTKDTTPYTLEWSGTTNDGSTITKSWTVEPHAQYGAPRGRDQDVFIAVLTLMETRGGMPEDGVVSTTRAELLEILGWPNNGKHYEKLRDCLTRIDRTIIASRDAFYQQDTETWLDASFRIWTVEFLKTRRRKDGRSEEMVTVHFDDVLIRSFLAAYLKGLDTELYWSLSSHLAKRLYRLVDRMRGERLEWEEDLFRLQDRIPIGPYQYPSKIKEKLEPAHAELVEKDFLQYAAIDDEARKVRYRVTEEFARRRETFDLADSAEGMFAMELMGGVGMGVSESQRLVAEYGTERCLACAQALPFQRTIKKTPLAWLRWAVKEPEFDPYPYLRGEKGRVGESRTGKRGLGVAPTGASGAPTQPELAEPEGSDLDPPEPDSAALLLWEEVLQAASEEIASPTLKVWFEGTVPTALAGETLTISAPNSFAAEYIESRFRVPLESALRNHLSPAAALVLEAHGEPVTDEPITDNTDKSSNRGNEESR